MKDQKNTKKGKNRKTKKICKHTSVLLSEIKYS